MHLSKSKLQGALQADNKIHLVKTNRQTLILKWSESQQNEVHEVNKIRFFDNLRSSGREFQSLGAQTAKAPSPLVTILDSGKI